MTEETKSDPEEDSRCLKIMQRIVVGCILGIVAIAGIVGIVLLIVKAVVFERVEYVECWSNETVWNDIESLVIPSNMCNDENVTALDLSKYPKLKNVTIGNDSFMYVGNVTITGLKKLVSVVIGNYSFTTQRYYSNSGPNRHFYLKNCPKLRELRIGRHSFDYYTVCEIENTKALEVIEMGDVDRDSKNFYYASTLELKSVLIHSE